MSILILAPDGGDQLTFDVQPQTTASELKGLIHKAYPIKLTDVSIYYQDEPLCDDDTVDIQEDMQISVTYKDPAGSGEMVTKYVVWTPLYADSKEGQHQSIDPSDQNGSEAEEDEECPELDCDDVQVDEAIQLQQQKEGTNQSSEKPLNMFATEVVIKELVNPFATSCVVSKEGQNVAAVNSQETAPHAHSIFSFVAAKQQQPKGAEQKPLQAEQGKADLCKKSFSKNVCNLIKMGNSVQQLLVPFNLNYISSSLQFDRFFLHLYQRLNSVRKFIRELYELSEYYQLAIKAPGKISSNWLSVLVTEANQAQTELKKIIGNTCQIIKKVTQYQPAKYTTNQDEKPTHTSQQLSKPPPYKPSPYSNPFLIGPPKEYKLLEKVMQLETPSLFISQLLKEQEMSTNTPSNIGKIPSNAKSMAPVPQKTPTILEGLDKNSPLTPTIFPSSVQQILPNIPKQQYDSTSFSLFSFSKFIKKALTQNISNSLKDNTINKLPNPFQIADTTQSTPYNTVSLFPSSNSHQPVCQSPQQIPPSNIQLQKSQQKEGPLQPSTTNKDKQSASSKAPKTPKYLMDSFHLPMKHVIEAHSSSSFIQVFGDLSLYSVVQLFQNPLSLQIMRQNFQKCFLPSVKYNLTLDLLKLFMPQKLMAAHSINQNQFTSYFYEISTGFVDFFTNSLGKSTMSPNQILVQVQKFVGHMLIEIKSLIEIQTEQLVNAIMEGAFQNLREAFGQKVQSCVALVWERVKTSMLKAADEFEKRR